MQEKLRNLSSLEKIVLIFIVIVPFLSVVLAAVLTWSHGIRSVDLIMLVSLYFFTGFGVTVGFHRLFTHRSFKAPKVVRFLLAAIGSMALQGSARDWVAQHRKHHKHSDDEEDPHSPHQHGVGLRGAFKGLWHAHVGWLFRVPRANVAKYAPDMLQDAAVRIADNLHVLWVALTFLIPASIGALVGGPHWVNGAFLGLLWGGLVRLFLLHHVTWSINSVCHYFGTRPFVSDDRSTNNALFAVIGFGEGWHRNHHAFPSSARHGLRWWELDLSWVVIRLMKFARLAKDVRVPSRKAIREKRIKK